MDNLQPESREIIRNLFSKKNFEDKFDNSKKNAIDVIVPVLHSTDLWHENLTSFYREIPINRLLIGDAGCIDETISIAKKFPRVEVIDHRNIKTLGSSIADLISRVQTERFAYLQSDVLLPEGWFRKMNSELNHSDWVGSPMQAVILLDYRIDYSGTRPLAGAQMGKSSIFNGLNEYLNDDYVYRQEDFVLQEYVRKQGGITSNQMDTFHFHQVMRRKTTGMSMQVKGINIQLQENEQETSRVNSTQLKGFVKYCKPNGQETVNSAYAAFSAQHDYTPTFLIECLTFSFQENRSWFFLLIKFYFRSLLTGAINLFSTRLIRIINSVTKFQ